MLTGSELGCMRSVVSVVSVLREQQDTGCVVCVYGCMCLWLWLLLLCYQFMVSDERPTWVWVNGRALEQDGGGSVAQRSVHHVAVTRDPADVGHAAEHVSILVIEHVLTQTQQQHNNNNKHNNNTPTTQSHTV